MYNEYMKSTRRSSSSSSSSRRRHQVQKTAFETLQNGFMVFDAHCYEDFIQSNEMYGMHEISILMNLEKYIQKLINYVRNVMIQSTVFQNFSTELKESLLQYCFTYSKFQPYYVFANECSFSDEKKKKTAALKALHEINEFHDLVYRSINHTRRSSNNKKTYYEMDDTGTFVQREMNEGDDSDDDLADDDEEELTPIYNAGRVIRY